MKIRPFCLMIPVALLGVGACEKKSTPPAAETAPAQSAPAAPAPVDAPAPAPVAAPPAATSTKAEERAAKLGFARHLPADTEGFVSIRNGNKIAERAKATKLWKMVAEQMGGMGMLPMPDAPPMDEDEDFAPPKDGEAKPAADPDEKDAAISRENGRALAGGRDARIQLITADAEQAKEDAAPAKEDAEADADEEKEPEWEPNAGDIIGSEMTLAFGKPAGEQMAHLMTGYERFYYFMMRSMTKSLGAAIKDGSSLDAPMDDPETMRKVVDEFLSDPQSGMALVERAAMPPMYAAFLAPADKRQAIIETISNGLAEAGTESEVSEPVTIEKAGAKLSGVKFSGTKIAAKLAEEDAEEMNETFGEENAAKLRAVLAKRDFVIAVGLVGDYVVLFTGGSTDDFALTNDPAKSLVAGEALAFTDAYTDKELAMVAYHSQEMGNALNTLQSGLGFYANGIRDGLPEAGLGDVRDLQELLRITVERETALRKMASMEAMNLVAYFDQGLHLETQGGYDSHAVDWKAPAKLRQLGDNPEVALFVNATADAEYDAKSSALIEALVQTAYAMAKKAASMGGEMPQMEQFKSGLEMFDQNFRTDVVALLDSLRGDFHKGLGMETAMVLDFKGAMPTVPGIPQKMIEKAKVPRLSIVKPVADRAKLASSWEQTNAAMTRIFEQVGKIGGPQVAMPPPMSSEKNGLATWYFSAIPFQSEDFMPSLTVGDQWFAASTSRKHALELVAAADKPAATERTGLWMHMNFDAMREFANVNLKAFEEHGEEMLGEGSAQFESFKEAKPMVDKLLEAASELEGITLHARRENGALRTSVHFKTR